MEKIALFSMQAYDQQFFDDIKKQIGGNFEIVYYKEKLTESTAHLAKGAIGVCVFVNDNVSKEVIDTLYEGGTRLIALRCAGFNNVDLKAAEGKLKVVRVPAYSPYAVAEFALGLLLALNRNIPTAVTRTKQSNFNLNGLLGFDIYGKTIGVIGTGKIAKVFISLLSGFNVNFLAYDVYQDHEFAAKFNVKYTTLDEIYEKSDVISLHCPLTDETRYMINADSINKMKKGVLIVNTGRGPLIDTRALICGIKSGKIGGAGLDVYEKESDYFYYDHSQTTLQDDVLSRLLSFKNVIVTSHQAFFTKEALTSIATVTINNINDFLNGKELVNEVK